MTAVAIPRAYDIQRASEDPTSYLASLIGLDGFSELIRRRKDDVFPILAGVILYRQLSPTEKRQVLGMAQDLGDRRFFGKVQALIATIIAQPYWSPWSLSDVELRDYLDNRKAVSSFIKDYFFTVSPEINVSFLAAILYSVSRSGAKSVISDMAKRPMAEHYLSKTKFSPGAVKAGGAAFLAAVVIASVIRGFSESEIKMAKQEMLRRGLLQEKDL